MLGQHLVVGLNSDASVRRLKGETRPLVKQEDRAILLSALACVDEVVIFEEDTPKELLQVLRPDILVKGGDYKADEVIGRESVKRVEIISFDYMDYADFDEQMADDTFDCGYIDVVFHEGACSDTMNYDGRYMMKNNYEGSKNLLRYCMQRKIPFLYASSASTYGSGKHGFREEPACEQALNPYAYSKLQFDRFVRRVMPLAKSQIVGFRYFNVFWKRGKSLSLKGQLVMKTAVRSAISSTSTT